MRRRICLLLVLALLLTACGEVRPVQQQAETEPEQTVELPAAAPKSDPDPGTFGLAYVPEYGFNPYSCTCITNRPVISLVCEGLFVLGSNFEPEPVLCDRFSVSETGTVYLFSLRSGICFSDGTPMTAGDVVTSLRAAKDSEYYGSRFSKVAEFTARDARTVQITTLVPYENLPLLLDVPVVRWDTVSSSFPVGSGPYQLYQYGDNVSLIRNSRWWQNATPPIDERRISLTAAATPSEIRDSFEFGTTSLVYADLNAPTAVGYRCDYELWDCRTTIMQYLGFNLNYGLFTNTEFRTAVTHIIDREGIIASVYKGFAEPAYLPCAPASSLYDESLARNYRYDEEAFLTAMRDAMVDEQTPCIFLVCSADPSRVEAAHRIADTLNGYGMKVEIHAQDYDTYRRSLTLGAYNMFLGETRLSGNFDLTEFFNLYGSLCYGGIQSGVMASLCRDALENSGNNYDLHKQVMDFGYFCPLLFKSYAVMANRGAIKSLQPAVDSVFHLSGGRTLADASTSYEEMSARITPDAYTGFGEESPEEEPEG